MHRLVPIGFRSFLNPPSLSSSSSSFVLVVGLLALLVKSGFGVTNTPKAGRMKFTDGQWLLQPGVVAHYAGEAYSIASADDKKLVVYAPVRPIKERGDTLQGPLLTITLSAPLPDIVRVRIEHFTGGLTRGPEIPVLSTLIWRWIFATVPGLPPSLPGN